MKSLTPEKELAIYRIAQEALNNARRHAEAQSVILNPGWWICANGQWKAQRKIYPHPGNKR